MLEALWPQTPLKPTEIKKQCSMEHGLGEEYEQNKRPMRDGRRLHGTGCGWRLRDCKAGWEGKGGLQKSPLLTSCLTEPCIVVLYVLISVFTYTVNIARWTDGRCMGVIKGDLNPVVLMAARGRPPPTPQHSQRGGEDNRWRGFSLFDGQKEKGGGKQGVGQGVSDSSW
ncbi:Imidazole glycerol phosphate synthase subunit HisH [Dissostichus eleginoides]|uniref:Imidazole glycerol phosphate synthase subunit HisH n=1 Tax=Dissostichus eleginoides TaxID=100907 RepID=A0AAD9CQV1_DISEL|nr:Imidazole glycerol phosphate synthase subunit HisH [Dissostichus eleginoides]